jgi:hypothetical protein
VGGYEERVAYLFRYWEVSRQANHKYLEALADVDEPTPAILQLDDITTRKKAPRSVES